MKKDGIEKIDEQIENLKNASKKKEKTSEVIIDKKYEYDNIGPNDTKKIDRIDDIKEDEEIEQTKELKEISSEVIEEQSVSLEKENITEEFKNEIEPPKKKNIVIPVLIISGILLIALIIVLLIVLQPKKKNTSIDEDKTLTKNEQKKVINGYGDALKGVIAVYSEKQNVLLEYDDAIKLIDYKHKVVCKEHEIYEDGSIYLDKCKIDDKSTSYSYGKKQEKKEEPKISEDAIKVYVSKKDNKATLKEPKNIEDYDLYAFEIDGAYSDLTLLSDSSDYIFYSDAEYNVHMLNYKTNKKVMDNLSYQSVLPIKIGEIYDTKYVAIKMNNKWGIYNTTNNERTVPHKYDSVTPTLYMGTSGPALEVNTLDEGIVAVVNYGDNASYGVVDYRTGKELIKQEYRSMLKSGSYLWAVDYYGDGHIFDYNGTEYLDGKYDNIYWMVDGKYILVNDKDEIKLVSIKGKDIYSYGKANVGRINYGLTYNDGALFQFENPDKDESDYNTGCVELIYDASTKTGEVKTSFCGGIAKPVLYLYPKKTAKVTISFEHPELLETTYPKYNNSWEVKAHSNGDLYDDKGAYYYALYWDEKQVHSVDFSTGYYVEKDNAIEFLEKKLSYIGLSRREANEFIMYWLPILEKNEKNLVYFELTEERESYNKLNISPKPDSLLRLVIHIKKVDNKVDIPKQNLTKFQRKGFVAVEWGGTVY